MTDYLTKLLKFINTRPTIGSIGEYRPQTEGFSDLILEQEPSRKYTTTDVAIENREELPSSTVMSNLNTSG